MSIDELLGKTVAPKSDPDQRYTVTHVNPKFDFGTILGTGPAVTVVRDPHGTESIVPGEKFLEDYEPVPKP